MHVVSLPTLDDLRHFVRRTLCEHDKLDLEESPVPLPEMIATMVA